MVDVADLLSYDPSYISKWISGSYLPNRKSIDLVLTKCSHYFAEHILASQKEIYWPAYFPGSDVPEYINNYHDMQNFIFKYLIASYNQSNKEINAISNRENPHYAPRNVFSSYSLDEVTLAVHDQCTNATNKFATLNIISTLPIDDLKKVIESHAKSYCMMFRSNTVHLRHFCNPDDDTTEQVIKLNEILKSLKTINPNSTIEVNIKPKNSGEFILVQGCFLIYRQIVLDAPLYFMLNDQKSIEFFGDRIVHYPYDDEKIIEINDEYEILDHTKIDFIMKEENIIVYARNPASLLGLQDMYLLFGDTANDDFLSKISRTMQYAIANKNINVIYSKSSLRNFLTDFTLPFPFASKRLDPERVIELIKHLASIRKEPTNFIFYGVEDNMLEDPSFNYDIVVTDSSLTYSLSAQDEPYNSEPFYQSRYQPFVNSMESKFNDIMNHPNTSKQNSIDFEEYIVNYIKLVK
ncbi:MAG: hypothetical protein GXZ11_07655 [Tissierellia bacterium]|nr:hypothetical protein [Tissierellia bacterium]